MRSTLTLAPPLEWECRSHPMVIRDDLRMSFHLTALGLNGDSQFRLIFRQDFSKGYITWIEYIHCHMNVDMGQVLLFLAVACRCA